MQRVSCRKRTSRSRRQTGFTTLQMVITIAIIGIISTFGIFGIRNARAEMRVHNSARMFAVYIEKARGDSIRRHAAVGSEATIQTFGPGTNTFSVRMDFDGSGTLETRSFMLDEGVTFDTIAQTATFDWRGRIPERLAFQIVNEVRSIPVDISGSGDVTVDDQIFGDNAIPSLTLAGVTNDIAPDPTPYPTSTTPESQPNPDDSPTPEPTPTPPGNGNGNGNGNGDGNGNGNGNGNTSPTPTPAPNPSPSGSPGATPTPLPSCVASVNPSSITLSQSIVTQRSQTVVFTLENAIGNHSVTAVMAGAGNSLTRTVSPQSLTGNGSVTVTIGSKSGSGNRGVFAVNISASPTCGSTQQVTVKVNN